MSKHESINSYILPHYSRLETKPANTPSDFAKAAFMAFIGEFSEFPKNSANMEFLKYCFEQNINQG